jgi:hypothetical protein
MNVFTTTRFADMTRCLTTAVRNERGAVTAEKAILTVLVIAFAWAGIHILGDPMRDQVFRIVFAICTRIYEAIAGVFYR